MQLYPFRSNSRGAIRREEKADRVESKSSSAGTDSFYVSEFRQNGSWISSRNHLKTLQMLSFHNQISSKIASLPPLFRYTVAISNFENRYVLQEFAPSPGTISVGELQMGKRRGETRDDMNFEYGIVTIFESIDIHRNLSFRVTGFEGMDRPLPTRPHFLYYPRELRYGICMIDEWIDTKCLIVEYDHTIEDPSPITLLHFETMRMYQVQLYFNSSIL